MFKCCTNRRTKLLLAKDPSFAPKSSELNWHNVHKAFTKFINKVRQHAEARQQQQQLQVNPQVKSEDLPLNESKYPHGELPLKANLYQRLYQSKPTKNNSLELLIDNIKKKNFLTQITSEKLEIT